ncbi:MAG: T9SS type A sorting domain-containing protein [Saprospiraceae bacterium]
MQVNIKSLILFSFFATGFIANIFAQDDSKGLENNNYFKIVNDFNTKWNSENHDEKSEKQDGPFAQFKRWEWFWQSRVNKDGSFPSSDVLKEESEKFYKNYNSNVHSRSNPANWKYFGPVMDPDANRGIGRLNCIAFHPTNKNIYWVGSAGGGLWKTSDNGTNWVTSTDNLPVLGISDMVIDPKNANIMYIATGDGEGADNNSVGVLKSTDGGVSWKSTGLSFASNQLTTLRKLYISPSDSKILLAAGNKGLYRTKDAGISWTKVITNQFIDIEQKPSSPNTLYASTIDEDNAKCSIYVSNNAGVSWIVASSFTDVIRIELAVTNAEPNLVLVLTSNSDSGFEGIYYSEDSGDTFHTWITGSEDFNLLEWEYDATGSSGQGGYDLCLAINPSDLTNYFVGGVNTWVTYDDGDNWYLNTMWTSSDSQNPNKVQVVHADKHAIVYHPLNNSVMFQCNDGGLFYSSDKGVTWVNKSKGLQISQIYRVSVSQTKSNLVIMGLQDNGSRANHINNLWSEVTGGDGTNCIIDPKNEKIQYSGYVQGVIYRTTDNWNTDVEISDNIIGKPKGAWVSPYVLDPNNTSILYAAFKDVYVTKDRGDSWTRLSYNLSETNLLSLAVAASNSKVIYVASEFSIYASYNSGSSWSNIANSTTPITELIVNPSNSDIIYITVGGYTDKDKVWKIQNKGQDWVDYSSNLPNVPINCILYLKGVAEGLYIGTDIGIYYTDETLNDWIPFNTNLPNVKVSDLDYCYKDNKIYAATYGRGLWASTPFSLPIATKDLQPAYHASLSPNPTTGKFNIFTDNSNDKIEDIRIINLQGEIVYYNSETNFGTVSLSMQLANGTYAVRYKVNQKENISKLIVYNN